MDDIKRPKPNPPLQPPQKSAPSPTQDKLESPEAPGSAPDQSVDKLQNQAPDQPKKSFMDVRPPTQSPQPAAQPAEPAPQPQSQPEAPATVVEPPEQSGEENSEEAAKDKEAKSPNEAEKVGKNVKKDDKMQAQEPPPQQHKDGVPKLPIILAFIITISLAALTVMAYMQSQKEPSQSGSETVTSERQEVEPATGSDVDEASQAVNEAVEVTEEAQGFEESELSDQSLDL